MFGFKFLGKTHIPHHKNTADYKPVAMPFPKEILLPTSQHIGAPATPIVKAGDVVKVGQVVAEAKGFVSSPIHSPVSGKVLKIETILLSTGQEVPLIKIENDGLMTGMDELTAPNVFDHESFVNAVRDSGVVGLGGAGFPTAVKLDIAKNGGIHTIVLNGAECEPYITSDTRTMLDAPELIFEGISLLEKFIPSAEKFVFGIEENKPECIEELARIFRDNEKVSIVPLPALYPQGAEKVMIYNTTGLTVPEGKLPADVGVLVINVTSLAVIANYIKTGKPLTTKCLTVDGSAVKEPKNVVAPIGATIRDVLEFVGVELENVGKVIFGGPMMGISARNFDEPITKRNNALTVMDLKEARERESTACIHCGRCVSACPMNLDPTIFAKALSLDGEEKFIRLDENKINLCMECGCCSYVCPANRPLVQNNRLAKSMLRDYKAHKSTLK